jgi:hypothetical protein
MWIIGDELGYNTGYAVASGDSICPEDMPRTWEYYSFDIGNWVGDSSANVKCQDGPDPKTEPKPEPEPEPEPEQCLKGSDCDDAV